MCPHFKCTSVHVWKMCCINKAISLFVEQTISENVCVWLFTAGRVPVCLHVYCAGLVQRELIMADWNFVSLLSVCIWVLYERRRFIADMLCLAWPWMPAVLTVACLTNSRTNCNLTNRKANRRQTHTKSSACREPHISSAARDKRWEVEEV